MEMFKSRFRYKNKRGNQKSECHLMKLFFKRGISAQYPIPEPYKSPFYQIFYICVVR